MLEYAHVELSGMGSAMNPRQACVNRVNTFISLHPRCPLRPLADRQAPLSAPLREDNAERHRDRTVRAALGSVRGTAGTAAPLLVLRPRCRLPAARAPSGNVDTMRPRHRRVTPHRCGTSAPPRRGDRTIRPPTHYYNPYSQRLWRKDERGAWHSSVL